MLAHTDPYLSQLALEKNDFCLLLGVSNKHLHWPVYVHNFLHDLSAFVSIRQHSSAYVCIRQHTSAYVSIRQHTSAHVCIRQHTSASTSTAMPPPPPMLPLPMPSPPAGGGGERGFFSSSGGEGGGGSEGEYCAPVCVKEPCCWKGTACMFHI
jgi:hypothetical protein